MAEVEERVAIRRVGRRRREICVEKYKLVSTHTARRSFATNLQKVKDVPLAALSHTLGHGGVTLTMRRPWPDAAVDAAFLVASRFFAERSDAGLPAGTVIGQRKKGTDESAPFTANCAQDRNRTCTPCGTRT